MVSKNCVEYKSKGNLHRLDGPAIEWKDGDKSWWFEGKLHRLGGPAIDNPNYKSWWVGGRLHRIDGPAVEVASGSRRWWLKGILVDKEDVKLYRKSQVVKSLILVRCLQRPELQTVMETTML